MFAIPADGGREPRRERRLCRPAELIVDLLGVEEIPPIVARTVLDDRLQRGGRSDLIEDGIGDLLNRRFVTRTDVVGLTETTSFEDRLDGTAVIIDEQPLSAVFSRAVHGKWLAGEGTTDEERNDLFRKLKRPVVVAAIRDRRRESEGLGVRTDDVV